MNQNPTTNTVWERQLEWFKDSSQYRTLDTINGELMEFEWNISQDSLHWSLSGKSKKLMSKMGEPEQFQGRIIFMSMFHDIIWEIKTMRRNVLLIPHLCLYSQKDFQQDVEHSSDLGQKQSGIPQTKKDQEEHGIESLN